MEDINLRELLYILRRYLLFVLFYLILSISVTSNNNNFHIEKIYAHLFTPNETATFVSIVYQLQAELESLGIKSEKLNELNDVYEVKNLVENIKQTFIQDFKSTYPR